MLEQLVFPRVDLRRMHLVLLGQLRERLVAANRMQGDLGFESRRMVTTGSLHGHCSSQRLGQSSSSTQAGVRKTVTTSLRCNCSFRFWVSCLNTSIKVRVSIGL